MRQFDVFRNPDPSQARAYPYLMILQSDLVSETRTVVAAPFVPDVPFLPRFNPPMVVAGHKLALKVTDLATMPRSALHNPVDNLGAERDRIVAAPDLLFTGI